MFDLSVYTSASGRVGRQTWWIAQVVLNVILFIAAFFVSLLTSYDDSGLMGLCILPIELAFVALSIVVSVKRLHDLDKSGWYYLIVLIPFVGGIILFVQCGFMQGTIGPNQYGDDPTQSKEFNDNYRTNGVYSQTLQKGGLSTPVIIGIVVGVVLCVLPIIVIAVVSLLGSTINDVFNTINSGL